MRLLLVEDSTVLRSSLSAQLRDQQWSVDEAPDGGTALAYLERYPYDIVVLDLMLPGIDGRCCAGCARATHGCRY